MINGQVAPVAATQIHTAGVSNSCVINISAITAAVFVGGSNAVTAGNGLQVPTTAVAQIICGPSDNVWVISATGTCSYAKNETP